MNACWITLILHVFIWETVNSYVLENLKPYHYYLNGIAEPEKDPSALGNPEGFVCSNSTRECNCKGQKCFILPQIVISTNVTILTFITTVIQVVPERAFTSVTDLQILEIIQGKLKTIKPFAFAGLTKLKLLNLAFNKISKLDTSVFEGLESLEELILMKNNFQSFESVIPAIIPKYLPELQLLQLGGNNLKSIDNSTFSTMLESKLEILHLPSCELTYIHPKGLPPLTKLQVLMVKNNEELNEDNLVEVFNNLRESNLTMVEITGKRFNSIPKRLLGALAETNISILWITGLAASKILPKTIPPMPRLKSLQLLSNRLQNIEEGAFDALISIKSLKIPKNLFTSFPRSLQIPHLEELDLKGYPKQPIRMELPEFSFSAMGQLQSLSLSYKSLLALSKNTFYGLSKLQLLNVRKCGISSVEDGVFEHLTSLRSLDISENPIFELGAVSKKLFYGLQSTLETLVLQSCSYQGENDQFWANLESLQTLDISNNSLSTISGIVPSLKHLKRVYASMNSIQDWSNPILTLNTSLETLDLTQNSLRVVTQAMIQDFYKIQHLNITQNQFDCSCDILQFLTWLNETKTTVTFYKKSVFPKHEALLCNTPIKYAQMPLREAGTILSNSCIIIRKSKFQYPLVLFAVILILFFSAILFMYIFRRKLRTLIWSKQDLPNSKFMYDAFVSYSANDSDWVFNFLLPQIENSTTNMRLCVYDRDFIAGEAITDCILESIKNSRRIVLVVSNSFLKSPWCKLETDLAHHILLDENREGLLLIRLGKLDLSKAPAHLKFLLSTRLYLEWMPNLNDQSDFWIKLKRALEKNTKAKTKFLSLKSSLV